MGMSIDTAITVLDMVEAHGVCIEAKDVAVETMRKYKKIEQILKSIPYGGDATVRRIQKVVDDKI